MENFYKKVVCVDEQDKIVGSALAGRAHNLKHLERHRGFSLFLFNTKNQLLIQKRSQKKFVFPGLWSNTVCSHPFINSLSFSDPLLDVKNHVISRAEYELGINNLTIEDLHFVTRLKYKATGNSYEGVLMEGHPSPQPYFQTESKDLKENTKEEFMKAMNSSKPHLNTNLQEGKWGEFEIDYIFICKKDVGVKLNLEEAEDYLFATEDVFQQFVEGNKISPWASLVSSFVNVFELAKDSFGSPYGSETIKKDSR